MQISSQNPAERNKVILLGVLGLIAIVFLWWTFIGFGSSSKPATPPRVAGQPTSPAAVPRVSPNPASPQTVAEFKGADLAQLLPVNFQRSPVSVPAAKRNIFAYYEPPPPTPVPSIVPTATPTPTPPVLLASLSPGNVFAKTADFTLEVSGDKLTPQMRIVIDNTTELPTRYVSPQQLSATVPASIIANPGSRTVMLRTADGKLYSNSATLSVAAPPTPNYSYIGILGTPRYVDDTAVVQDKANKETLSVKRGDLLGGRFRVTSISEKEVVVVDNNLNIKHKLPITAQGDKGNPLQRPTPRVESEDDEP